MVNTRQFVVRPASDARTGEKYVRLLNIKAPSAQTRVGNLSGGNQQKVVLGKWFNTGGEIYIFDEPSLGIDVGSKQEIYNVMVDLLKEDKAILMVSSDMPEVISMSDRVIVFKQGQIAGELAGEDLTEEAILTLSIGDGKSERAGSLEHDVAGQGIAFQAIRKPDRALDLRDVRRDRRRRSIDLDGRNAISDVHQSGQHREHPAAGRSARNRRHQHDHGDGFGRHRSLGRHAGFAGVDHRRARDLPVASRRRSLDPDRRHVGNCPRNHHGVHHFENSHRAVHHHPRGHDLVPRDCATAFQFAGSRDEGRVQLFDDEPG
jgi:energy-coupling factor transporter ATP-binding protein EcfA2